MSGCARNTGVIFSKLLVGLQVISEHQPALGRFKMTFIMIIQRFHRVALKMTSLPQCRVTSPRLVFASFSLCPQSSQPKRKPPPPAGAAALRLTSEVPIG